MFIQETIPFSLIFIAPLVFPLSFQLTLLRPNVYKVPESFHVILTVKLLFNLTILGFPVELVNSFFENAFLGSTVIVF